MKIFQWLNYGGMYLAERCPGAGRIDAEVLLGHCTGKDRVALYRDGLESLTPPQERDYQNLLERRAQGEPVAYITGHKEFMGLDFMVNPSVLIPRPETELLVEKALERIKEKAFFQKQSAERLVAVDVGTGSGAIAISLAVFIRSLHVFAIDISGEALLTAQKNAESNGVADRVEFVQGDLLTPVINIPDVRPCWIVANLPYIPSGELSGLMSDVRDYEPFSALDGGVDGLDYYRRLIPQAGESLLEEGFLLMEIAPGQGAKLQKLLEPLWAVELFSDLAGRERLVVAQKRNREKA